MAGTDNLSPEDRQRAMRSVRSQDTIPEQIVRRIIFRLGYRYRLNRKDLPGKPDIVFLGRRKAIFVHGCFWHGHDCKAGNKRPKTNEAYWTQKLQRNKERDEINYQRLTEMRWQILIVWECELKDTLVLEKKLIAFLEGDGK
jgi:DNA mismatch endonuclease (patch repair protein)